MDAGKKIDFPTFQGPDMTCEPAGRTEDDLADAVPGRFLGGCSFSGHRSDTGNTSEYPVLASPTLQDNALEDGTIASPQVALPVVSGDDSSEAGGTEQSKGVLSEGLLLEWFSSVSREEELQRRLAEEILDVPSTPKFGDPHWSQDESTPDFGFQKAGKHLISYISGGSEREGRHDSSSDESDTDSEDGNSDGVSRSLSRSNSANSNLHHRLGTSSRNHQRRAASKDSTPRNDAGNQMFSEKCQRQKNWWFGAYLVLLTCGITVVTITCVSEKTDNTRQKNLSKLLFGNGLERQQSKEDISKPELVRRVSKESVIEAGEPDFEVFETPYTSPKSKEEFVIRETKFRVADRESFDLSPLEISRANDPCVWCSFDVSDMDEVDLSLWFYAELVEFLKNRIDRVPKSEATTFDAGEERSLINVDDFARTFYWSLHPTRETLSVLNGILDDTYQDRFYKQAAIQRKESTLLSRSTSGELFNQIYCGVSYPFVYFFRGPSPLEEPRRRCLVEDYPEKMHDLVWNALSAGELEDIFHKTQSAMVENAERG
jgi:hypothetical protein